MIIIRSKRFCISIFFILFFTLLAIVFSHNKAYAADGTLKVHYIDVGQADSILVDLPDNKIMLIDGGTYAEGDTVVNYLKAQGVTNIDYMINTHPHNDHVGGLIKVMESGAFTVDEENIYMAQTKASVPQFLKFTELLATRRIKTKDMMAGDVLIDTTVDGKKLVVKCIAPYKLLLEDTDNFNNNSIVLKLEYGDISYLFMADAEEAEEKEILAKGEDVKCDVLKVGHHGSNTSSTQEFVDAVKAKAAVFTAEESENSSGLPAETILTRFQKAGADIYRTDLLGNIVSESDGKTFKMDKAPKAEIYLPSATITFDKENYTYTGSAIKPKITVKIGGIELKEGVDYYCEYKDNINVGKATLNCIGKGDYYGTRVKKFTIVKKSIAKATSFKATNMVYTGAKLYPTVTIKDGSKKLKADTDYTISYTKTTSIGEGVVTVSGKGNYSGSKKIYFKIKPKKTNIIAKKSLTNGKIMLQWNAISGVDGYQIFYSKNNKQNFKSLKYVKNGNTTSIELELPTMNKYYFYIRAYKVSGGKKYFAKISETVGVKHKKSIEKCKVSKIKKLKYTGKPLKQKSVVVKIGKKKLKKGTDYVLSYKNNKKRGTATIIIKGKGFYSSTVKKKFKIV